MKITWTYFPKPECKPVTLTVIYLNSLVMDNYLHVETNTAFVNWELFRVFRDGNLKQRQLAYKSLTKIDQIDSKWLQ
ncbi:hypothetical protein [Runella sp. SP2]|uniref:hypothetical protein n=1 Tax=Runella sp. SP2 TaxID=2268026 RepID=UPI000F075409|nr:hypothetical protein [Runella sp. SP2]AYQ31422.1 hypothetical protein DTQ70_04160 [Runella sp. SP2]